MSDLPMSKIALASAEEVEVAEKTRSSVLTVDAKYRVGDIAWYVENVSPSNGNLTYVVYPAHLIELTFVERLDGKRTITYRVFNLYTKMEKILDEAEVYRTAEDGAVAREIWRNNRNEAGTPDSTPIYILQPFDVDPIHIESQLKERYEASKKR